MTRRVGRDRPRPPGQRDVLSSVASLGRVSGSVLRAGAGGHTSDWPMSCETTRSGRAIGPSGRSRPGRRRRDGARGGSGSTHTCGARLRLPRNSGSFPDEPPWLRTTKVFAAAGRALRRVFDAGDVAGARLIADQVLSVSPPGEARADIFDMASSFAWYDVIEIRSLLKSGIEEAPDPSGALAAMTADLGWVEIAGGDLRDASKHMRVARSGSANAPAIRPPRWPLSPPGTLNSCWAAIRSVARACDRPRARNP